MLSLVFGRKNRTEDLKKRYTQESGALTAEVDALKQSLERSENELGLAKKQLEDKEGKKYLV